MFKQWKWYIYILLCENNTFYTGCTWNIQTRMRQHFNHEGSKYTKKHRPIRLIYFEEHIDLNIARNREKQIKMWSQDKKMKLVNGEWKSSQVLFSPQGRS